jgi:hypothetical protein
LMLKTNRALGISCFAAVHMLKWRVLTISASFQAVSVAVA